MTRTHLGDIDILLCPCCTRPIFMADSNKGFCCLRCNIHVPLKHKPIEVMCCSECERPLWVTREHELICNHCKLVLEIEQALPRRICTICNTLHEPGHCRKQGIVEN